MGKPVLYHTPQSRGATTLWMNEELGQVCDIKLVNLKVGEQKQPDYLKLNPMGKVPVLSHDGAVVTEAAAICAYLADAFPDGGLAPATTDPKRGVYYRWMFFAPSCIEPMMMDKLSKTSREASGAVGHGTEEAVLSAIQTALSNGPFILGETFSAADVVFGSTLNFAIMFGAIANVDPYKFYVERLRERSAFIRAQEMNTQYMKQLGLE